MTYINVHGSSLVMVQRKSGGIFENQRLIVLNSFEIVTHRGGVSLKYFLFQVASNKVSTKVKAISFAENGSYFVTAGNRWVDNTNFCNRKQIFFNAHHWIIFQTRQVLVPGIFSQRQVQGGCSSDGKISYSWGTEKQLFLWCRMWTRRNGKIIYPCNSWQSLIITGLVRNYKYRVRLSIVIKSEPSKTININCEPLTPDSRS